MALSMGISMPAASLGFTTRSARATKAWVPSPVRNSSPALQPAPRAPESGGHPGPDFVAQAVLARRAGGRGSGSRLRRSAREPNDTLTLGTADREGPVGGLGVVHQDLLRALGARGLHGLSLDQVVEVERRGGGGRWSRRSGPGGSRGRRLRGGAAGLGGG